MQIKADFTKEQLMLHHDVLSHACNPLGKIRMLAELLSCLENVELSTGLMMQKESIYAMGISLTDACDEIEYLIDISDEQWRSERQRDREHHLESFMRDMATRMEEEPEDWNFKAAADNIRKQLKK